jgi:hypothetical protein
MSQTAHTGAGSSDLLLAHAGRREPEGVGGWLAVYAIGRVGLLVHQLQLTVGAIVIFADPAVAGLRTFVPLTSLLLYEATNWLLGGLTVAALVSIRRRTRAAIRLNLTLCALWLVALVVWQFLGLKSGVGTIIDATPAIFGLWYFLTSRRVRNTLTRTPGSPAQEGTR